MEAASEGTSMIKIEPSEAPIEIRVTDTPVRFESTRLSPRRSQAADTHLPEPNLSSALEKNTDNGGVSPNCDEINVSPVGPKTSTTLFGGTAESVNQTTADNSEIVKERIIFKQEFTSLNARLGAYVQKVREKEYLLDELSKARAAAEHQLEQTREELNQQINMLRSEVEHHVKQTVEMEAAIDRFQRELDGVKRERDIIRAELTEKRKRELSLERQLVSEHSHIRSLREENSKFREQRKKDEEDRLKLNESLTRLKVENATLQERAKIASFELKMQETKVVEAEKKLLYSAEDVSKKVAAERSRLEKLGMGKLEEMALKHQAEIERIKREHTRKMNDALVTYVTAEEHARLDTKLQEALKRAEGAEALLAERDELVKTVRAEADQLKSAKNREIIAERRKREKLNKRLMAQKHSYDEICQEVETYRKLIESLDIDCDVLANTPIGAKRPRTALDQAGSSRGTPMAKTPNGTSGSGALKARQLLLRKVLTPKKKFPQRTEEEPATTENESDVDEKPDCKMM